jgi:phytoene dehydrogenase-like protein
MMPDSNITKQYDVIVVGGGHNGLICAHQLALKGKKVIVLEAEESVGGFAKAYEFSPGFSTSAVHTLPQLSKKLISDLQLDKYGFSSQQPIVSTLALDPCGEHITISADSLTGVGSKDQQAYKEFRELLNQFSKAIRPTWGKKPPRIEDRDLSDVMTFAQFGLNIRLLGKEKMAEFTRVLALPTQDLMDEFFENPLLKAALSWDFLVGNKLAPRSPNNAVLNQLLRNSGDLAGKNTYNTGAMPVAKVGLFINALVKSCQAQGVTISCNSRVDSILVAEQKDQGNPCVNGVRLNDGQEIHAPTVISNLDAKTSFKKLLGLKHLDIQFSHRINRIRDKSFVATINLALRSAPNFTGVLDPKSRLLIAPSMSCMESAFDYAKYGELPNNPIMEVMIPSLHDNTISPPGHHVLSAQVMYVPYELKRNWDQAKPTLLESILATLETYAPGIRSQIIASELLTPKDLESRFNVSGGHWHHGEFCIDQWWVNRPTYGTNRYSTPMQGFYLCGAGAHPGGGIMGAAGQNAAKEVLKHDQ